MAHKVIIDVEARFNDQISDDAEKASDSMDDLGSSAEKAKKKVDDLGKKKARPIFDADNNKFLKKIREAEARAEKLGKTKTTTVLKAVDNATTVIGKVLNKAQKFGGSVWSAILKVKDSQAVSALKNVSSIAKTIAGKTWEAIVKVKDYALTPLNKIKNALFNIKTLAATVFAGFAAQKLVLNPINIADAYSSAKIGFQTLLGDSEGQSMMDSLDEFAKKSPFDTTGVISNAQKMLAMGWNAEDIVRDMETIGNAAASTGNLNQGLESIVRALSQIKTKGKLSTEELNQLAEAGIAAKSMLAEQLGYGTGDSGIAAMTKDLEAGAIGSEKAIEALLAGMKKYDGMMDSMANETVEGLWSQIQDTFQVNILRKWGQGLQDGAKRGLGAVVSLLDTADEALGALGDTIYDVGKSLSNWAADKLERAVETIKEVTKSDAFKNASLGGKIKILWNEVIAEPFSKWWNSTGKKKVAEIAGNLGETIGKGMTGGLLALLGFNAEGALADGVSIGGSFMEGFLEGFDTDKIGEALKNWVSENKVLATVLGGTLAFKLISGLAGGINSIKGLFGGGKGTSGGSLVTDTALMTVTADVVNVYGYDPINNVGGKGNIPTGGGGGGAAGTAATGGALLLPAGKKWLTGSSGGGKLLLPGGGSAVKGLLTGGGGTAAGGSSTLPTLTGVTLKNGTVAAMGGKLSPWLAKFGVSLGSGATTGGGAAAVGGGAAAGIVGGILGLGSAAIDLFQGRKKAKVGDKKGAKDEYVTAGTKTGMVATGAGIGAGVGALFGGVGAGPGALIGAGIGGVAALFTGGSIGKWISDATDDGGALSNAWGATKKFFTESVPEAWDTIKKGVSGFFTKTLPEAWDGFWNGVSGFFTSTVPTWWNGLTEKVSNFFTVTIPEKWNAFWDGVGTFFLETIPYALGYVTGKVYAFFTKTVPHFFGGLWNIIATFFTKTLPEWAENIWNNYIIPFFTKTIPDFFGTLWDGIKTFFTETLPEWAENIWNNYIVPFFTETVPQFFETLWDNVTTFFTETLPEWAENIWNNYIVPFFTESIPQFFSNLWDNIKTFFTETLPEWAENVWNNVIVPFFTESIPSFFVSLWDEIKTFFTETIPEWADSVWNNNIVPFFTETIPGFFGDLWDNVCGFFNESIDFIAEQIWAPIKSFFTEIIPGWASSAIEKVKSWWGTIKDSFMSGFSDGSGGGGGGGGKARGGIVGGTSSSMEAFARGGIVGGSTRFIRVNEEAPEMIIPLSSQRRDRAMKLWMKTGQLLGVPGFARGGITTGEQDEGLRFTAYDPDPKDARSVTVQVGDINIELKIEATDKASVVQAIKDQIADIAESVAEIFTEEFEAVFENTPVRGGT